MRYRLLILPLVLLLHGCYKSIVEDDNATASFTVFWDQMNQGYPGFDERRINWDSIYTRYSKKISAQTSEDELKSVFREILNYINDLHVSIQFRENEYMTTSGKTIGKSLNRQLLYRHYFSRDLSGDSVFAGQLPGEIAYLGVPDFMSGFSGNSLRSMMDSVNFKGGFIIDLRDNHGGYVSTMNELLSYFCPAGFLAGYEKVKTGPGHNDFSGFREIFIEGIGLVPAETRKVVLINENVFSAANIFAAFIRGVPNTTLIGVKSSGGAGYPVSTILPNNWILSFPRNKLYDKEHRSPDSGVNPDIIVNDGRKSGDKPGVNGDATLDAAMEFLGLESR